MASTSNTLGDFPTEFAGRNFITLTNPPSPSFGNSMNWNGIYTPEESFTNLVGYPLNGDWVITIRDNLLIDDGYIFGWEISFDTLYTPVPLSIFPTSSEASCGQCNGTATVNVSGGNPPYNYSWNTVPIQTTQTLAGLCPGTYIISVTEVNSGNILIDSVIIVDNMPAPVIDSIIALSDNGSCNGAAMAYITSPFPYTISWNPSLQTTNPAVNLCDGGYCITVTDTNNCAADSCVTINLVPPVLSNSAIDATCEQCNGTASVTVNNGNPPYNYMWTSNNNVISTPTINTITNLCPGIYFVSVSGNFGSTLTDTIVVNGTSSPIIDSISTTIDNGNCDGTATAYITSAIPYSISWTPTLQTTNPAINLCDGQYCITVTDTNGCITDTCVTVDLITGVNELETTINAIYPNPVKNQVTVTLASSASGQIKIKNTVGQLVLSKSFNEMKEIIIEINIPSGVYFLEVEIEGKTSIKRLIKE